MMHYWGQPITRGYGYGGIGLISPLLVVLFWAAVIFLFIALIKGYRKDTREYENEDGSCRALDILKERYAKGDIGKKKFDEMKKDILKKD
jgi:putative membrane protein